MLPGYVNARGSFANAMPNPFPNAHLLPILSPCVKPLCPSCPSPNAAETETERPQMLYAGKLTGQLETQQLRISLPALPARYMRHQHLSKDVPRHFSHLLASQLAGMAMGGGLDIAGRSMGNEALAAPSGIGMLSRGDSCEGGSKGEEESSTTCSSPVSESEPELNTLAAEQPAQALTEALEQGGGPEPQPLDPSPQQPLIPRICTHSAHICCILPSQLPW